MELELNSSTVELDLPITTGVQDDNVAPGGF